MVEIKDAERKIIFAEYLVHRPDNENYLPAAQKHILLAANIAVQYLTKLDKISPQLVTRALEKFEEKQAIEFSKFYMNLWESLAKPPNPADVSNSLKTVKAFVDWVKKQKQPLR